LQADGGYKRKVVVKEREIFFLTKVYIIFVRNQLRARSSLAVLPFYTLLANSEEVKERRKELNK